MLTLDERPERENTRPSMSKRTRNSTCWPSRMDIYCSVGPLECKFMASLKITHFWCISLVHVFSYNFMDCRKMIGFIYAWLRYGTNRWRVKPWHRAKADSSRLSIAKERKACSERRWGWGFHH